jgi:hypothetical protein
MNNLIDVSFNVFSDTPPGKDPDTYSPTLRKYHKLLWSKPLPNGVFFSLEDTRPKVLYHKSEAGEFILSSDSIGHTYRNVKNMAHIVNQVSEGEIDSFFKLCSTIGGYMIFPSKRIENKITINGARGFDRKIQDRFDLTLECIRRFYINEVSPLQDTLNRYSEFLNLFSNFKGYVDFFLLQDLVSKNYLEVNYFHPFEDFNLSPLPKNINEYLSYKESMTNFLIARNRRIQNS